MTGPDLTTDVLAVGGGRAADGPSVAATAARPHRGLRLADIASAQLPADVAALTGSPGARVNP
jgi:hypothetical protein